MPFDSENQFVPVDPSDWNRVRGIPRIIVHPKQPLPEGIDNWLEPGTDPDGGPDDWFVPPPTATPTTAQFPPIAQPNGNFGNTYPAVMPDPFAAYWSQIPASGVDALPWVPPYLPGSSPWTTNNFAAPTIPRTPLPRTPTLGLDPLPPPTQLLPGVSFPTGGILGGLAALATSPPPTPLTSAPALPRTPTLGLDPLPPPTQLLPGVSFSTGGILGGLAALATSPPATTSPPAPGLPRTPTLGLDPLPPPTRLLPGLSFPTGGILGGLAALGTPWLATPLIPTAGGLLGGLAKFGTPSPPAPSLAGESSFGSGGPTTPAMPGTLQAFWDGLRAGSRQVAQSVQSLSGQPTIEAQDSPAAAPLGWSDLASPSGIAPKIAYQFAQSYPTLAGGVAGGVVLGRIGALAGPEGAAAGALIGGGLGAAALSAAQTLGPIYAAELQRNPNDPEGAWNRAWRQAEISGAFSGAAWAAFPARFFQSPVKQLVFQIFGVQPALTVGHRVTSNIAEGRPATEGLGEAYGQGVVGTAIPALGHGIVRTSLPKDTPAENNRRSETTSSDARGSKTSRGVWDLPPTKRGRILEKVFGHNLHPDHPTIDIWDPNTGAVTSLKSVDLEAPGYQVKDQYVNALYNKLSRGIDKLVEFEGGRYGVTHVRNVTSRTLTVIVPVLGTAEQRQVLRNIVEVGRQRGVTVRIEVYR